MSDPAADFRASMEALRDAFASMLEPMVAVVREMVSKLAPIFAAIGEELGRFYGATLPIRQAMARVVAVRCYGIAESDIREVLDDGCTVRLWNRRRVTVDLLRFDPEWAF